MMSPGLAQVMTGVARSTLSVAVAIALVKSVVSVGVNETESV